MPAPRNVRPATSAELRSLIKQRQREYREAIQAWSRAAKSPREKERGLRGGYDPEQRAKAEIRGYRESMARELRGLRQKYKTQKRAGNPATSAAQYRLAEAVLHGRVRTKTGMSKKVAREIIEATPAKQRSEFIGGKRKKSRNPAVSAAQYRLAEAVAHGTARTPTRMTKAAAQEIIARTPAKLRSKFMKQNPHRKRNPEDAAAAAYEEFHGKPPEIVTEVDTPIRYHKNVAGLGKLKYLDVARDSDGKVVHLSFDSKTYLTENEARNQLFVTGGDQSIDLQTFGISTPHEYQVLGRVVAIGYFTEKKHLISKDGGRGTYDHPFGYTRKGNREVKVSKSCPPTLIYDTRNELLSFAGGSYTIAPEGIDG